MKVAFIAHISNFYGANRSLLALIQGLQSHGVQSHVVLPADGRFAKQLADYGIPYKVVPFAWWVKIPGEQQSRWARWRINRGALPEIVKQLRSWQVDLVHSNSLVTPIGAAAAKRLNLPHVWHLREFVDLDYNLKWDWGKTCSVWFLRRAAGKIANSQAVYQRFLGNTSTQTSRVIYNGIATGQQFEDRKVPVDPQERYTFAVVGLVSPSKKQETAIRAMALLRDMGIDAKLLVVGGGAKAYLDQMKQLTVSLKLEELVEFWGQIDDPLDGYRAADAVLMCSENEAMGRVTAEAMSICRPVIGFAGGGTPELIKHEQTGLLYSGASQELAKCMQRLISDSQWGRELGLQGWQESRQRFTIEEYSAQVYDLYSAIGCT